MIKSVTPQRVESLIADEEYHKIGKKMTVCLLTLTNGHEIIGTAGCVDPEAYDENIGNPIARKDAVEQIWALEGYALQVELSKTSE